MIEPSLAILLGAGASYDLIGAPTARVDGSWKPPLTDYIFGPSDAFQSILDKYPGARSLAATIKMRLARGDTSLENVLRDIASSTADHIVRQFREVPLYLQDLFGQISNLYASEPVNYSHLFNHVFELAKGPVLILTTNYDLFVERALESVLNVAFRSLDSYVDDQRFLLVKLHGSVNWGYAIEDIANVPGWDDIPAVRTVLSRLPASALNGPLELLQSHRPRTDQSRNALLYPALTVPVAGKYAYVCPQRHLEMAKQHLSNCTHILIIGMSGRDDDVRDLLMAAECCRRASIVSGPDHFEVSMKFNESLRTSPHSTSADGFSQFLLGDGLDNFLSEFSHGGLTNKRS